MAAKASERSDLPKETMSIALASDHVGFPLKEAVKNHLRELGLEYVDFGTDGEERVDYPDFGSKVAVAVSNGQYDRGVLVCGSGIGMSIVANRYPGVRAALCTSEVMARLSKQHNDANVLVLSGRLIEQPLAMKIVDVWLNTKFEGGRHARRLEKIEKLKIR